MTPSLLVVVTLGVTRLLSPVTITTTSSTLRRPGRHPCYNPVDDSLIFVVVVTLVVAGVVDRLSTQIVNQILAPTMGRVVGKLPVIIRTLSPR